MRPAINWDSGYNFPAISGIAVMWWPTTESHDDRVTSSRTLMKMLRINRKVHLRTLWIQKGILNFIYNLILRLFTYNPLWTDVQCRNSLSMVQLWPTSDDDDCISQGVSGRTNSLLYDTLQTAQSGKVPVMVAHWKLMQQILHSHHLEKHWSCIFCSQMCYWKSADMYREHSLSYNMQLHYVAANIDQLMYLSGT